MSPSPPVVTSQVKPQDQGKPQESKAQDSAKVYEIKFNGVSTAKVRLPAGTNLNDAWTKFQEEHKEVTAKREAFPTSFIGDLVNKYDGEQVDKGEKADDTLEFRI